MHRLWFTALALTCAVPLAAAAQAPDSAAGERVKMGVDAWRAGNFASALTIWRPLAEAGNADAQFNLAQAYRLGRGTDANPTQAMDWYQKAARQGHQQAEATYGLMLYQNGDQQGAMPWLQKAADHGDPRALYVVATAQFNGDPLPKDWVGAYARMTRAAASGLPQAKTSLAEMDRYIPAEERAKGTALAEQMGRAEAAGIVPVSTPPERPAPPPIRTTELPPSQPALPRPAPAAPPAEERPPVAAAVTTPPPPPPAPTISPAPASSGRWRVQFGAFASAEKARQAWSSVTRRVSTGDARPFYVAAGAITRLQAGPFADRGEATRLCVAAKAAGQDCFVTAAN